MGDILLILDLDYPWAPGEWSKFPGVDGKKIWVLQPGFNGKEWIAGLDRKYRDKMNDPFKADLNAFLDTDIAYYAFGFGRRLESPFIGADVFLWRPRPAGGGLLVTAHTYSPNSWLVKAGVMDHSQAVARVQYEDEEAYQTIYGQAAYWIYDRWMYKQRYIGDKIDGVSFRVDLPGWVRSRI